MIRRFVSGKLNVFASRVSVVPNTVFRYMASEAGAEKADKKKKGKFAQSDEEREESEMLEGFQLFMDAHDKAKKFKPQWDPEVQAEHIRIGKEYQRQCYKRHSKTVQEATDALWFQREALRALPEDLRAKAMIIDDTHPPHEENLFYTPPIKGFESRKYEEENVKDDMDL